MKLSARHGNSGLATGLLIAPMVIGIGVAVLSVPHTSIGLTDAVARDLPNAGASNPVTAVLMNFRAYDTLLEIAVLVTALLGARALAGRPAIDHIDTRPEASPVLLGFVHVISPLLIIVAGYLLWVGGHAPGGAFQAGSVLASLGVLLLLCGIRLPRWYSGRIEQLTLVGGLAVFLVVGLSIMSTDRVFLQYPVSYAKGLVLLIEAACTLSIAAILFTLFAIGNPSAMKIALEDDTDSMT